MSSFSDMYNFKDLLGEACKRAHKEKSVDHWFSCDHKVYFITQNVFIYEDPI